MVNTLYLAKRIVVATLSVFVIASLVFGMTTALPGSAAEIILGTQQTPEAVEQIEQQMGLDRPLSERYVDYMVGMVTLDWGESLISGEPVTERVIPRLQRTLELAIVAMIMTIITAIPLGIVTASKRDTWIDNLLTGVSYVGISMPSFVSASLLLLLFTTGSLNWFPNGGYTPLTDGFFKWLHHLLLPAIALNFIVFSYVLRQTRSSMIETLESKFIRTARLKGVSERSVLFKHAMRNGLLPTVTVLALNFGWMMGSVVIVEEIFTYPGLGKLIVQAIHQRDLPVLQAAILVPTVTFITSNLLADIIYTLLDPRIELGEK
ncbi:ABC transporter permease [Haloarculaceae archaeon H-GB2-1]|nr:ABC transporter permease [Haloarculaceae archaeon H-GB1-1]MEA5387968.1 ABC transporter permease [Haloarculaceae archaeon H-GB11]MEA5409458.1 ABC transporter permease [Haloarculaceae archaeon H-GB2-1]